MRDLLLIAIVVVCSLIALRRPVFGLLAFVALGFLNPHSLTWTIGQSFRHSLVVGAGTLVGFLFWSEPKRFPRQREVFLLVALWAMFAVSTLLAIYPAKSLGRFIEVSKIVLMVFLATSLINSQDRLNSLLRVIGLSVGFYGLKGGVFALATGGQYLVFGPEHSFLSANNSIGLALAMNIPLLCYLLKIETEAWLRWIVRAMLVFSYPAIVATYSRGAWLGLVIVSGLLLLRSRRRLLVVTVAGIVAILIAPFAARLIPVRLSDRYDDFVNYEEDASAQARLWSWELCKRVGLAHPVSGGGFDFYDVETYAKYYPEFLEYFSRNSGRVLAWSCHSIWLTMLSEHGFSGLLLWVSLIVSCLLSLRQVRLHGRDQARESRMSDCAAMVEIALVAFMVVGTFLDATYFDMFYYLVAVVIILKENSRKAGLEAFTRATTGSRDRPYLVEKAEVTWRPVG